MSSAPGTATPTHKPTAACWRKRVSLASSSFIAIRIPPDCPRRIFASFCKREKHRREYDDLYAQACDRKYKTVALRNFGCVVKVKEKAVRRAIYQPHSHGCRDMTKRRPVRECPSSEARENERGDAKAGHSPCFVPTKRRVRKEQLFLRSQWFAASGMRAIMPCERTSRNASRTRDPVAANQGQVSPAGWVRRSIAIPPLV